MGPVPCPGLARGCQLSCARVAKLLLIEGRKEPIVEKINK